MRTAWLNVEVCVCGCPKDVTRFSISIPHVKWNQQQQINKHLYMHRTSVREKTAKAAHAYRGFTGRGPHCIQLAMVLEMPACTGGYHDSVIVTFWNSMLK